MIYLKKFTLLNGEQEDNIIETERRNIYNNYYPLGIFTSKKFEEIEFENVKIYKGTS